MCYRGGVAARSGWSGLGLTTFQRVIRLVSRLQRQSEDKTIGPGVPRKLAFLPRVRVSRIIVPAVLPADQEPCAGGFFFWMRFENLVAKRRKINDRVVPIL